MRRIPQYTPKSARVTSAPNVGRERAPSHHIRVTPLQSRQPFPDRNVIPDTPTDASTNCSYDVTSPLNKDRHAFFMRAASATRVSVKMDTQKPTLKPDLFYLIACCLLNFDFERGEFQAFEAEVHK